MNPPENLAIPLFTQAIQSWSWSIVNKKVSWRPHPLDCFLSSLEYVKILKMSVTPIPTAQTGSIVSDFPSCTTNAEGGGSRQKGELKNLKANYSQNRSSLLFPQLVQKVLPCYCSPAIRVRFPLRSKQQLAASFLLT